MYPNKHKKDFKKKLLKQCLVSVVGKKSHTLQTSANGPLSDSCRWTMHFGASPQKGDTGCFCLRFAFLRL